MRNSTSKRCRSSNPIASLLRLFLPTRWMRGSSPRMTNVERQPGRQILTLLVPGGRGDKGNLAPIKLTPVGWVAFLTRPNIQIASARCWVSHALDPTYASRPAVLFWCHRGSGDAVSAGQKEPSAGGSILPRVLNPSREPLGGHSLSKLSSIEEAVTRSLDRQACTHDVALGAQVLVPSGRGIATRVEAERIF